MFIKIHDLQWRWLGLLAGCVLSAGCSSTAPAPMNLQRQQADQRLEQIGNNLDGSGRADLESALDYFEQMDLQYPQWEANFKLAGWYIAHDEPAPALPYARRARVLAETLGQPALRFASAIQVGQLTNDEHLFQQAQQVAQTDVERAIALTYLKQYEQAAALFKPLDARLQPSEFGFLYYRYGKQRKDQAAVLTALDLYRQAGDGYGVVDCLFLAARLAKQPAQARDFGERALRAARHLKQHERSKSIELWLAALPDE